MTTDKSLLKKIEKSIRTVENDFKKVDEWIIPRDRTSFYLTHDYHPYFAAFPPELVSRLLEKYSKQGDVFLDPFMGGGSSIVEGFKLKRKVIGVDISPFSKFLSAGKATPIKITEKETASILSAIKKNIESEKKNDYNDFSYDIPTVTNIDKWFSRESKFDLAIILHHLKGINDKKTRNFFLLAFSSIVRKASNAKNAEQHLCIVREKKIPDVFDLFEKKTSLMIKQMEEYVSELGNLREFTTPKLYSHDCRRLTEIIPKNSVDIVITSPPYGTGSRYTDIYRLNFQWLEFEKPERKTTLETTKVFTEELKTALTEIYHVLKKGKYCFFVYGDPSTENSITRTAVDDAKSIGFSYKGLISCPIEKKNLKHHTKYRRFIPKDFILILQK